MRKKFIIFFILLSLTTIKLNTAYASLNTSCSSILLFELKTQSVLYEKNANQKMFPASITKIMTAIIALEKGKLDDILTVDDQTPYEIYGSHISLEPGEQLSLKDLLYALMLPSANDAAEVIAKTYGGSVDGFVKLMNEKASELGAKNTHFVNPHGLHDEDHYTTAEDLAKIVTYAMKNQTFREIVKTPRYEIPATNKKEARKLITTNNLLLNTSPGYLAIDGKLVSREYEGAMGIKNGYTPEAGNCLVSYVEKDGLSLVAIVLKGSGTELYTDTHNLFNYGFNNYKIKTLANANEFIEDFKPNGSKESIPVVTQTNVDIVNKKDEEESKITTKKTFLDVSLPIKKGEVVGKLEFIKNDKVVGTTNIISTKDLSSESVTTLGKSTGSGALSVFKKIFTVIISLVIGFFVFVLYNRIRIKIKRYKRKKLREQRKKQYMDINR